MCIYISRYKGHIYRMKYITIHTYVAYMYRQSTNIRIYIYVPTCTCMCSYINQIRIQAVIRLKRFFIFVSSIGKNRYLIILESYPLSLASPVRNKWSYTHIISSQYLTYPWVNNWFTAIPINHYNNNLHRVNN